MPLDFVVGIKGIRQKRVNQRVKWVICISLTHFCRDKRNEQIRNTRSIMNYATTTIKSQKFSHVLSCTLDLQHCAQWEYALPTIHTIQIWEYYFTISVDEMLFGQIKLSIPNVKWIWSFVCHSKKMLLTLLFKKFLAPHTFHISGRNSVGIPWSTSRCRIDEIPDREPSSSFRISCILSSDSISLFRNKSSARLWSLRTCVRTRKTSSVPLISSHIKPCDLRK